MNDTGDDDREGIGGVNEVNDGRAQDTVSSPSYVFFPSIFFPSTDYSLQLDYE
jgi:hypothetical protein